MQISYSIQRDFSFIVPPVSGHRAQGTKQDDGFLQKYFLKKGDSRIMYFSIFRNVD